MYALRENVNVVMNPERTLVIGAIDRNHLMVSGPPNPAPQGCLVGCYIILVNGVPVAWRAKSQKCVSLSSSEAEFYACVEAVKEVPFIAQILVFMGVNVRLPVDVRIDNVGAMFMSENVTSTPRTRHMDARYWWITDLQESGLIKVSFVPTKDNLSDIGTKNVTGDVFDRIRPELMVERPQSD